MKIFVIDKKLRIIFVAFSSLLAFIGSVGASTELDKVLKDVREDYNVQHISNEDFIKLSKDNVIVFDVRQQNEYQVSRLINAIHLDPNTSVDDFFKKYSGQLENKTAVFYCSVGERSSKMLSKLNNKLKLSGVLQAYNLEGGVFKWSNDKINLLDKNGDATNYVHPYNNYWGRLVNNKSAIKYK